MRLLLFTLFLVTVESFFAPSPLRAPSTSCSAAKGFGNTGEKQSKQSREKLMKLEAPAPVTAPSLEEPVPTMNAGQRALEKIRRERAEQKNAELQRARELLQQDIQVQQTAAAIPEKVAQRMGQRMIPFVGIPLFLSMGVFIGFWYMATYRDMSFEPSLVAASTILILVLGLLGITYSVMSTSWDPDRQGSLLGTDEFSRNLDNIKEGLSRSRDNAVLRDKLATDTDMQRALSTLDQEESKKKKIVSLESKLNDELE